MADIGLTSTGLRVQTTAEARAAIVAELHGLWGASFDLGDSTEIGQLIAIVARAIGDLGQLAEAVYAAGSRDSATGSALDAILLLTGTFRPGAASSTVTLTLTGTATTLVPSGSRVKSASTGAAFATTSAATIAAATAWANSTAYVVGDRRKNGGNIYECITAGTSAGSGGPTTTAADITDGTAHWRYLGAGAGYVDVAAASVLTGAIVGVSGDLTVIDTPVGGWSSVINTLDATLGRDVATDEEARILGETDLARPGASTPDAIRETLLALDGVESVTVFYNATDTTDGDGIPPHAVEAMVLGGDDQAIYDALLGECIAAGIATHGTETGTALDSEGVSHTVKFSRPTEVPIWIVVNLTKKAYSAADRNSYPLDGDAQVKAAIVAFGDAQVCGKNAVSSQIAAQAFQVAGVFDVTACYIDTANTPPATSSTIAISTRQIATYDTSRISVVSSSGTP